MRRRLVLLLLMLLVAICLLMGRLVFVQVLQSKWLSGMAKQSWEREIPLSGIRGSVLDSEGEKIAYTASAPSLLAVPSQVKDKEGTAQKLAPILGMPEDKILNLLKKKQLMVYLKPGGKQMSEATAEKVRQLNLPGIYMTEEGKRAYPYGNLAAQVLGITGSDNQGITGIEKQYDNVLQGVKGSITFYAKANGELMPGEGEAVQPATDGNDVKLTINRQIQQYVEREIEQAVADYNPDNVTAIVEDPKSGAILGMANYPTFDPANWRNYPQSTYNQNLAIWKTFEPGSTFKIVTLSAALQENKVNLNDGFYDPGYYEVAGHRIRCWKAGGHGSQTFLNVVENSCNPGFIALGERLGKTTLLSYVKKFGFGQKTGIDLPGEGNGILFKENKMGPLELATTAFGQGVSVTPIQQVMALGAVANGGKLMKPYVVQDIQNHETGQVISEAQPTVVRQVISASTATKVRGALESVVANGSGRNAYKYGYRIAGKTGTAQVAKNGRYESGHYIVSFIGMAPANDPKLIAYIAIDNPHPKHGIVFGGVIAAPIVGNILQDSLQTLGVQPSTQGLQKKYRYGDVVPVDVPNFTGLSVADAKKLALQNTAGLNVEILGAGSTVIAQSPPGRSKVDDGSTIRLYLGDGTSSKSIDKANQNQ
ncbi:stage V sporulation protein D [Alicyclobacillus dauci]|uniref:Stage V sporulation protein D n=1 Tax=Alicyclobacillus dauci TaxID=1475485 RepID=A0ABY6ZAU1_9BACL|nr:stage V sporulation protein D [Alicyclobacillus dauci]WAH39230.1 stage V sporulation protein D [Alicyclobacillus dauci]